MIQCLHHSEPQSAMEVVVQSPGLGDAVQVPGARSTSSAPAATLASSSAVPSLAAPNLAAPSSVTPSAAPQKEVSSAAMSQELPSFHDWSQNTASPSSKSDATSGAAAASAALSDAGKQPQNAQPRLRNRSEQPDLADAKSVLIAAGLAQAASASAKLSAKEQSEPKLFNHQQLTLPNHVADQQDKGLQSDSQASDMTNAADVSSQEQGEPCTNSHHASSQLNHAYNVLGMLCSC